MRCFGIAPPLAPMLSLSEHVHTYSELQGGFTSEGDEAVECIVTDSLAMFSNGPGHWHEFVGKNYRIQLVIAHLFFLLAQVASLKNIVSRRHFNRTTHWVGWGSHLADCFCPDSLAQ